MDILELSEIETNVLNYCNDKGINIDVTYNGKIRHWDALRDHYYITITKKLKTGKLSEHSFTTIFYDSVNNSNKNKGTGEQYNIFYKKLAVSALYSVITDTSDFVSYDGKLSFEQFCNDFGYEAQVLEENGYRFVKNTEAFEIYKACKNTYLGLKDKVNLSELMELFQDY